MEREAKVIPFFATLSDGVTMRLVTSGEAGNLSARSVFSSKATAKPPQGFVAPQFGFFVAGDKRIAYAIDEPEAQVAQLVVDLNGNGDLSDDIPIEWAIEKSGDFKLYRGSAAIDLGKGVPIMLKILRFDPRSKKGAALKNTLVYSFNFGYELSFSLDGKPFQSYVPGEPSKTTIIQIDRNGDGKWSASRETVKIGEPFNFTGTSYKFDLSASGISLRKAAKKVPQTPLPPNFAIGQPAIPISATAIDGTKIDLLRDYKGKIVMIDFWATWCVPCRAEIPNLKAAYAKYHDQGFEILGISLDKAGMADKLKAFMKEQGMPWRQIFEGKFANTRIGTEYDVSSIPFTLLIDGDTGKILGDSNDLSGERLAEFVRRQLALKRA